MPTGLIYDMMEAPNVALLLSEDNNPELVSQAGVMMNSVDKKPRARASRVELVFPPSSHQRRPEVGDRYQ